MTDIPKRQSDEPHYASVAAHIAHEHAVAKVAVQALRELDGYTHDINLRYVSETIREALAKIEASGWRP